jgi:nucleotide-binding universal stress UspA family protein
MKRILIATDGSKASDAALEEGTELARHLGAAVLFVYVTPYPPALLDQPYYQRKLTRETADAREAIEHATAVAGDHGVQADWEIFEGDPAAEILHAAREWEVDLIVIGSRGLGAVVGTLLGSVSRAVVHGADRPVLVAPSGARRRAHAAA